MTERAEPKRSHRRLALSRADGVPHWGSPSRFGTYAGSARNPSGWDPVPTVTAGEMVTPKIRAVPVYCRVSNDPAQLGIGVDRQLDDCVALAKGLWPRAQVPVSSTTTSQPPTRQYTGLSGRRCSMLCDGRGDEIVAYELARAA
jgi:hypothetical protein